MGLMAGEGLNDFTFYDSTDPIAGKPPCRPHPVISLRSLVLDTHHLRWTVAGIMYSIADGLLIDIREGVAQVIFKVNFRTAQARESGGRKSPSGVQGRSPGREFEGRSPPEAETHCRLL